MKLEYLNIRPEGTPQRIYTYYVISKISTNYDENTIMEKLCPVECFSDVKNRDDFFGKVKSQCDIFSDYIEESNNILASHDSFRKGMRKRIFNLKTVEGEFTKQYLSGTMGICSIKEMLEGGAIKGEAKIIKEENLLCWRFWMQYCGLGVLQQDSKNRDIVIYNFSRCIEDFMEDIYPHGASISLSNFLNGLMNYCEVLKESLDGDQMRESLSMSMKLLQMKGRIELKLLGDATKSIYMAPISSIAKREKYSQIVIHGLSNGGEN